MSIIVETPFQNFTGLDGKPLTNGKVYIGQVGTDPTVFANQIPVFWDKELTIPATQPLQTNAGYIIRAGTPARVWTSSDYSMSVKNASAVLVYYIPQFGALNFEEYAKYTDLVALSANLANGSTGKGANLIGYRPRNRSESASKTVQDQLDSLLPISYAGFQVQPNKTIKGPDGKRFIAKGVTMFDYLFVSYEARSNINFRQILNPPNTGAAFGISEPTYYARIVYKNAANVEETIKSARAIGVNLIRVAVEPAIMNATVSYVDPTDGITYPSDPTMLDEIIETAERLGVAVQIQNARDDVPTANNVTFMAWLTARYYKRKNVWINPANEINGTNADVNNPVVWAAEMRQYLIALRSDIPGQPAGTKFKGPICIDAPGYGTRIDLIVATLTGDTVFSGDPNLILQPHYYSQIGESDWRSTGLVTYQSQWVNYISQFCIMIGEVGIDNFAGRFDPNLDPSIPSANLTTWAQMQSSIIDFLQWCNEQSQYTPFNGVIGHMWFAYIPGLSRHDDNSMVRQDGSFSTWGEIFRDYYAAASVSILAARRALGAQYSTGAWLAGDIANNAVTNVKLDNMAQGTIKGRSTAGTSFPEDLTSAQALNILAGLASDGRVSNATMGTPIFQAEGLTGVRAASGFIVNGAGETYIGLHNRSTGLLTGAISGNGTTGVNYTSVSDYRLKTNPQPVMDALSKFAKLIPVEAGWKFAPDAPREIMFLAHEVQNVVPSAVHGDKDAENNDGPIFQTVDYGKLTPIIAAALHAAIKEIDSLKARITDIESK